MTNSSQGLGRSMSIAQELASITVECVLLIGGESKGVTTKVYAWQLPLGMLSTGVPDKVNTDLMDKLLNYARCAYRLGLQDDEQLSLESVVNFC